MGVNIKKLIESFEEYDRLCKYLTDLKNFENMIIVDSAIMIPSARGRNLQGNLIKLVKDEITDIEKIIDAMEII